MTPIPGTGLPPSPHQPFPTPSPGPPNNRLPGWVSGDISDVRQQLLEGIKQDPGSLVGIPVVQPAKGNRKGAGLVLGKINATSIGPSVTAHDILKTELVSGSLIALWEHMHLLDMPLGSANFVFVEDGSGNPALALLVNANVAAAAAIAYSKLNLTNSINNLDVAAGAGIAYTKLNLILGIVNQDISNSAAIARTKLEADPAGRMNNTNGAANTTAVAFAVIFTANPYQNATYVQWNGASALSAMVTGTYNITACLIWPPNATGIRQIGFRYSGAINGNLDTKVTVGAGFSTCQNIVEQRRMNAGDYVELLCLQTSGGSLPPTNDPRTCVTMEFVGL